MILTLIMFAYIVLSACLAAQIENKGFSPIGMLGLCEGDCDIDSDCQGNLTCFQRETDGEVPGCNGTTISEMDYCYDAEAEQIVNKGFHPEGQLGLCEGDCDEDSDCRGNLRCFQREKDGEVPGCYGSTISEMDYCYGTEAAQIVNKGFHPEGELGLCEGDCDEDSDCRGNLRCFQREKDGEVPGCHGSTISEMDYCYGTEEAQIVNKGFHPEGKLGLCEGDCDEDSDCLGNLVCFQRETNGEVLGCYGSTISEMDYCVSNASLI